MITALDKLSVASQALAEADTIEEILPIMGIAEHAVLFAKRANLGLEVQNRAARIHLNAARKAGQKFSQLERGTPGGNGSNQHKQSNCANVGTIASEYQVTLDKTGVSHQTVNRWEHIGKLSDEIYIECLDEIEANRQEITISGVLQIPNHVTVTLFSHKSKEYYTPKEYADAARKVMGGIDLDPASCDEAQKNIGAKRYYTESDDGLAQDWRGRVWLNPPYSKTEGGSNQAIWSRHLVEEYESGNVTQAILLVKAALGYKWFEELWDIAPAVCFARNRLSFILEDGTDEGQSKQGTAFFYFGENIEKFIEVFTRFGRAIAKNRVYQCLNK